MEWGQRLYKVTWSASKKPAFYRGNTSPQADTHKCLLGSLLASMWRPDAAKMRDQMRGRIIAQVEGASSQKFTDPGR